MATTVTCNVNGAGYDGYIKGTASPWNTSPASGGWAPVAHDGSFANIILAESSSDGSGNNGAISVGKVVFDTSNIPANATITSATINLFKTSASTTGGGIVYCDYYATTAALVAGDWNGKWALPGNGSSDLTSTAFASINNTSIPANTLTNFTLSSPDSNIAKGSSALTAFRLALTTNGAFSVTYPGASNSCAWSSRNGSTPATLTVIFTVPTVTFTSTMMVF